jgi:hypothetical protein
MYRVWLAGMLIAASTAASGLLGLTHGYMVLTLLAVAAVTAGGATCLSVIQKTL